MPGEAAVEHRPFDKLRSRVSRPRVGAARVAPCVEALLAHDGAVGVGYRRPRAEVVFQDVVNASHAVFLLHHGENAERGPVHKMAAAPIDDKVIFKD